MAVTAITMETGMIQKCLSAGLILIALSVTACASKGAPEEDPFEAFNRKTYAVNKKLDQTLLKPAAKTYDHLTPKALQNRVSDFLGNIEDVTTLANNLLQFKMSAAGVDLSRIIINSTVGLAGLFDVASRAGIQKNDEDFGQTLGAWGVPKGPYVMLPVLGPRTLRGLFGTGVDSMTTGDLTRFDHVPARNSLQGLDILNFRVGLFALDSTLADAIDEYAFVRDSFLQREDFMVYDGNVPEEEDDFWDEEECEEDEC